MFFLPHTGWESARWKRNINSQSQTSYTSQRYSGNSEASYLLIVANVQLLYVDTHRCEWSSAAYMCSCFSPVLTLWLVEIFSNHSESASSFSVFLQTSHSLHQVPHMKPHSQTWIWRQGALCPLTAWEHLIFDVFVRYIQTLFSQLKRNAYWGKKTFLPRIGSSSHVLIHGYPIASK